LTGLLNQLKALLQASQFQRLNGLKVYGIKYSELPLVQFNIVLKGGHLLDSKDKVGVANLMTDIMMEGTVNKTPEELEEEIELLGANINMFTQNEAIVITANSLRIKLTFPLKLPPSL